MVQAIDYLQRIHGIVIKSAGAKTSQDEIELCRRNIRELGLPEMMATLPTARSYQSSLKILYRRNILYLTVKQAELRNNATKKNVGPWSTLTELYNPIIDDFRPAWSRFRRLL